MLTGGLPRRLPERRLDSWVTKSDRNALQRD